MRFIKLGEINWKYILSEIFLIFVGINLAIWFNDWNTSKTTNSNIEIALHKIKGELNTNLEQLTENRTNNQEITFFLDAIKEIQKENSGKLLVSPKTMSAFEDTYKDFFTVTDSTYVDTDLYNYEGDTYINLDITELSRIAWETSKSTGIFHEFGYECLYELEGIYNTQNLVQNEIDKATEALRNQSIDDLGRILKFVNQLEIQLESQYKEMIKDLENCR
ncbi:hypothetical protein DKG77_06385 [Flagellimonas aquimarina]|jgi:hypothetical protein|uniref:Uncharacterized protein n=1 Tax=Flagellimonas aquimarina TaxID=2201895 RepID=A0A316L3L6_9FLAO|nr:hypothetical protein [Allomuricauda koreensis]PWL40436.1 hypothetical protein DKG77_06385 [Allomuricauda koreensis]